MARRLPKKKEEISKEKPESLMMVLKAGSMFGLVVIGIIGSAISLFSGDGIVAQLFGKLTDLDADALIVVPIFLGALYFIKIWFEKTTGKSSTEVLGNMALFLMMGLGLYFLYNLLVTGSFIG